MLIKTQDSEPSCTDGEGVRQCSHYANTRVVLRNSTSGCVPQKKEKKGHSRYLYTHVHSSFIRSQVEGTQNTYTELRCLLRGRQFWQVLQHGDPK